MLEGYDKVLVTGGCGFIGRHLVRELLSLGRDVTVLDNFATSVDRSSPDGARFAAADIREASDLSAAVDGIDLIFHVAANASGTISIDDPRFDFETNVVGTLNMLDAAIQAGTKRFLQVASASVYGVPQRFPMDERHPTEPFVPYGASKLAAERYALTYGATYGLDVVVGRPVAVYGPGENPKFALVEISRFLRWHLNGKPIQIVGDIERKTRDFVHVSDLVQGLITIAQNAPSGEVYNIGSGDEISMRELTDLIAEVTGRETQIDALPEITEDTYRLVADITKLRSLGYAPQTSLKDGIADLVEHLGESPELPGGATIFRKGQEAER